VSPAQKAKRTQTIKASKFRLFSPQIRSVRLLQEWIIFARTAGNASEPPLQALRVVIMQEMSFAFSQEPGGLSKLVRFFSSWAEALLPFPSSEGVFVFEMTTGIPPEVASYRNEEETFKNVARSTVHTSVHDFVLIRGDGNCLFDTTSGCLGIATGEIQKGDEVYLIEGMRLLIIVRTIDGVFRLIGCMYFDGVMQGEL